MNSMSVQLSPERDDTNERINIQENQNGYKTNINNSYPQNSNNQQNLIDIYTTQNIQPQTIQQNMNYDYPNVQNNYQQSQNGNGYYQQPNNQQHTQLIQPQTVRQIQSTQSIQPVQQTNTNYNYPQTSSGQIIIPVTQLPSNNQLNGNYEQIKYVNKKTFDAQLIEAKNIKLKHKHIDSFVMLFLKQNINRFDYKQNYKRQNNAYGSDNKYYDDYENYVKQSLEWNKCASEKTLLMLKLFLNIEESVEWNASLKDFIETYLTETKNIERIMYKCCSFAEIAWGNGNLEKLIELLSDEK